MNILKRIMLSALVVIGLVVTPVALVGSTVQAATPKEQLCLGSGGQWNSGSATCTNANSNGSLEDNFKTIVNILLFIIGAVGVVMIIIGGIRYVVSAGDQGAVTGAKNTILYAVVGLAVAIMGYAIVNFVISSL